MDAPSISELEQAIETIAKAYYYHPIQTEKSMFSLNSQYIRWTTAYCDPMDRYKLDIAQAIIREFHPT